MDTDSQEQLQDPPNSDIPGESEPTCLGKHETFFNTCDASSNSLTVDPLFASQHDKRGHCTGKEQTQTPQNIASKCDMEQQEMGTEKNYTSPQGVSGNTGNGNHQNPRSCSLSSKIQRELESRFLRVCVPFLTTADIARIKKGLSRSEEKTQTSGNGLKECDMEQEERETKNMWKLRANRVEQIFSALNKQLHQFKHSRKLGLEFNVGFGPKQNISVDCLSNSLLLEIAKFALAINSSQQDFIMEILEYNLDLGLQSEHHRNTFTCEVMDRVRQLTSCEDAVKFSNEVFELPGPVSSINVVNKNVGIPELGSILSIEKCDVAPVCLPDSHAKSEDHISHKSVDLYPWCKEIGLKLHVNNRQPHKTLEINKLTNGAMTEVMNFAEKLCGTFEQICLDILRHNFDLDSQNGDSDLARNILARFPAVIEENKLLSCSKAYQKKQATKKDVSPLETLDCQNDPNLEACGSSSSSATIMDQNEGSSVDIEYQNEPCTHDEDTKSTIDPWRLNMQKNPNQISVGCGSPLHGNINIKEEEYDPYYGVVKPELDTEEEFYPHYEGVKERKLALQTKEGYTLPKRRLGSQPDHSRWISEDEAHIQASTNVPQGSDMEQEEMDYSCTLEESDLDSDEGLRNTGNPIHLQSPENCSLSSVNPSESEPSSLGVCEPFLTTSDILSRLPIVNPPYSSQLDKEGLHGDEEQTHAPRNALNKYDAEEEEMETEKNMWKLRSNRIEQILSGLNKQFCRLTFSRRVGVEFNVGICPKQSISVDCLSNTVLLEIAKFALEINSSQKDFIMEILEYNFDLSLQSQHHRNIFAYKLMERVRQLRSCEDAVKFSNEVFELPGPMASINVGSVIPELSSILKTEKCDVPVCLPDSNAENIQHISCQSVGLYPWCKGIGLKLHVNSQPHKKMEIKKLTNGAMTEVTNFTEKLCGTFEQICLDILRHNFDLDLQNGDSDLARNILARIPAAIEHKNLATYVKSGKGITKKIRKDMLTMEKLDCQNNPNLDAFSDGSSSAAITDQKMDTSGDNDQQTELNLKLWKLRVNQIQRILSTPHEEHCPFYSYSRCKKLGIDFNVGSGVKRNLDPTLLTNGIMVELNTFATAVVSARKHFVTEILEYNFDLNLYNELCRSAFAKQTHEKCTTILKHSSTVQLRNAPFELPDMMCIQNSTEKMTYCPKCHEARWLHQDESNPGHMHNPRPHCMMDSVSADAKCIAQMPAKDPSSTFSTTEETIMDSSPRCKKIGLDLCVNKDKPKDKLDTHVLTRSIMMEVINFARKLCGRKYKIINDVLEHNFNIDKRSLNLGLAEMFCRETSRNDEERTWLNEGFDFHSVCLRPPRSKDGVKRKCVRQGGEWKETIKKRKLALQAKEERDANRNHQSTVNCYPICTEIDLDLDVTSKSRKEEKLDLQLLTTAVVLEIHKFATKKVGHYARTVFDILDCNFDLSSQHYRRWEFSIATASKFQTTAKQYCEKPGRADEVFRLPFVLDPKASERFVQKRRNKKSTKSSLHVSDMEQMKMRPENSYTCPLDESDLVKEEVRVSGNTSSDDHLPKPKSCSLSAKIQAECGSRYLRVCVPFLNIADISCSLPAVNTKTFAGQPDKKGLHRCEEKTVTSENALKKCELTQEEMETEMMWKLRSNRVEQILSALNNEFGPFNKSKKVGLEFNVGFGPKQNISVDFLSNRVLLEIAKFALAINSSQKDFILEILEYNFDLGLQSQNLQHRNVFAFEVMDRVRQLRSCKDAITVSSEVFELPGLMPSVNMANQSASSVISKPSCISRMENAETVSCQSVDLYPWCKKIGLKLHVNNPQPHKKLKINKLTNGAMTEVMNFAEKLCGTFEQFCLDILRHNFDLDSQNGDSDLARNILARIPATMEQQNLSYCVKTLKMKGTRKYISTVEKLDCQNNPTSDVCGAGSSQAAITDQTEGSSADSEHKNELNLQLWKLRANQIQQILSIPHEEHCPLYHYSRCKKLGIDFNVGSGVKQNLDPKLLTNGIMVEFNTFATALVSATRHFITEILEYNFNLNFKNELYRSAFAKQTVEKISSLKASSRFRQRKLLFKLPDMDCIQPLFEKTTYCPKCYQDRRDKLLQDVSDHGHMNHPRPNFRTDSPVASDAKCMARKPAKDLSPTFSKAEEELMDSYPRCKELGLTLCVDKDKPKDKLDTHVLKRSVMMEVVNFAKRLCGVKTMIVPALVKHNFNIGKQSLDDLARLFSREKAQKDGGLAWFDKVFVIQPVSHREPGYVGKVTRESAMTGSERKETILKRKLALRTKEETATLPSPNTSVVKSKRRQRSTVNCFPICTEIGLDLDVTSKSGEKEKLDLKLLTKAAAVEIHKFVTSKRGYYYPGEVYDILDYNFDLSSQHDRRWEFSIAAASTVQATYKQYLKKREKLNKVVKLPFVFPPKSPKRFVEKKPTKECKKYSKKESDKTQNRTVHQVRNHSDVSGMHFFGGVKTEEEHWYYDEYTGTYTDPWMMNVQINQSQVNNPHYGDVEPELDTEKTYHSHYDEVKTESDTGDVQHLFPGEPAGSLEYALTTMCPSSESNIKPESETEGVQYYFLTEPQGSEGHAMLAVCPSAGSLIKTESDPARVTCIVSVETAASQGYTMMNTGQGHESALIKEEHEDMPVDSYQ